MIRDSRKLTVLWLGIAGTLVSSACASFAAHSPDRVGDILLAAFVDTRPLLGKDARITIDPFQMTGEVARSRWASRDLALILADTSVRLSETAARGPVRVSFSVPEFDGDTARILVATFAWLEESGSRSLDRLTLVRRAGKWTVVRREQLMVT